MKTFPRPFEVRKRRCLGVHAALVISILALGCAKEAPAAAAEAREGFPVGSVSPVNVQHEREFVGEVLAVRYAEVRARLGGLIESVEVDEGQAVEKDRTLFVISAQELQQELLKARAMIRSTEAELKLARLEAENTKMLFERSVVSTAEMALAESKVESLAARLQEAKASENQTAINLTYARVKAPFSGVLNRIPHKAGAVIGENDLLTTIADTSEVYVYFRLSEREYLEYGADAAARRSEEVAFKLADGTVHSSPGVIDATESEFNKDTGNLAFRARFPNPNRKLKHGSTGKIVLKARLENVLVVPQKSTFEVQGHLFVYALDADDRARAREIVPKVRIEDKFVVASGLKPEDRFILEGVQKVKDGARVDTLPPP